MSKPVISGLSVILVDDVRAMRTLLKALLRSFGIQDVLEASDGAAALDILCNKRTDLVITDLSMSPMDGIELTRQLRRPSSGPNALVPVIVVSAHNDKIRVKEALEAGVTDFLLKPVSCKALGQRLTALIERPKPIIKQASYYGPDRRRRKIGTGNDRRIAETLAPR